MAYHRNSMRSEFGMTQADIARAASWLQSQGFTVDKVADSRNAIWFSGTAAQAEAAFHTSIHKYFVNGKMHFANAVGGLGSERPGRQCHSRGWVE